jgi:hypothetical protein
VSRLTLLFFGAAKDVPESSKNGHPPDSPHFSLQTMAERGRCISSRSATSQKVKDQRNHGDYQQNVNQPARNVKREKPQQPNHKQNTKQR